MYSSTVVALILGAGIASAAPAKDVWKPTVGLAWQISLSKMIDPSQPLSPDVPAYDIDLFDADKAGNIISGFHAKGKKVICYFSAGSYEDWRSDASSFQAGDLGDDMGDWPGEKWLDVRTANVRAIMTKRIEKAAACGCDAIDPDNVDGYNNPTGKNLSEQDSVDYLRWMAGVASANGLSIGLKNANAIIPKVIDVFHFSVNEQCHQYKECNAYQSFIQAGKPVFNIEYPNNAKTAGAAGCSQYGDGSTGFSTLIKTLDLDQWVQSCPIIGAAPAPSSYPSSPSAPAPSSSSAVPVSTKTKQPTYGGSPTIIATGSAPSVTGNPGQSTGTTLSTSVSSPTGTRTKTGSSNTATPTHDSGAGSGYGKNCQVVYVED